ncbi:MAG: OmpA family protein [Alphaproteobacteria bacterium]|nr:OmpA family protein [Alphaproteobacteria bacterium]
MKNTPLILAAASALLLAACQSTPNYGAPPLPPGSSAVQPPPPAPSQPAPLVGTAGKLTQVGVGRYMDGLEANLRGTLRGQPVFVIRRGEDMLVVLPDSALFAGKDLGPSGSALLASIAAVLRYYDRTLLQVNGYTDTLGNDVQNLTISQDRAKLVMQALVGDGLAASRLEAHGFGATNLRFATGPDKAEPRNRRIELHIVPRPD